MKGLAVSQIILLVLGIIVLAVVAYLLYTQFVGTGNAISAEQCRASATRVCTGCQIGFTFDSCPVSSLEKNCQDKVLTKSGTDFILCQSYVGSGSLTSSSSQPINQPTPESQTENPPAQASNLPDGGSTSGSRVSS